ncbi:MAG TPA: dihydrofolate reductase family protein [Puia sp.]|nr:dihydrofolate reductase family protein [Puia sp.]
MRKLIYSINLTIDGCVDHTKAEGTEEIHEYFTQLLRESDLLIYGRITYELMVPFWPDIAKNHSGTTKAMNDFAQAFDSMKGIVVFSKTLDKPKGKNTRIIRSNLRDEILKLKQEEGRPMLLGGVDLPSQLMALDLIDEYRFVVHPILAGEGRRLLEGIYLQERLKLKLADTKRFNSGCVALHYLKR